jgi:hypothetical protein
MPTTTQAATEADHDLETESTFSALAYMNIDLSGRQADSVEFARCHFKAATLTGSRLTRPRFSDCLIENSDWSNLHGRGGAIDRARLTASRLTGLAWIDGLLRDVAFDTCKLDLTNWRHTRFTAVAFTDCNLTGADFTDADLRGASFTRCDLTGAQFSSATMTGTRFRGCELAGIGGVTSWTGAVVHQDDLLELAHILANALGIVVERQDLG